jgi:hypothetical protein
LIWCSSVTRQELTQTQPPRNVQKPVFLTSWLLPSKVPASRQGCFFVNSEILRLYPHYRINHRESDQNLSHACRASNPVPTGFFFPYNLKTTRL